MWSAFGTWHRRTPETFGGVVCLDGSFGDARARKNRIPLLCTLDHRPPSVVRRIGNDESSSRTHFFSSLLEAAVEIDTITNTANSRYITGRRTRAFIIDDRQA